MHILNLHAINGIQMKAFTLELEVEKVVCLNEEKTFLRVFLIEDIVGGCFYFSVLASISIRREDMIKVDGSRRKYKQVPTCFLSR